MNPNDTISIKTTNDFSAEFAATAADRAGLSDTALFMMNIDVNDAVATASKAEASLAALREQVAKLSVIDMAEYDKITTYARALAWAQARYTSASNPPEGFLSLIDRAAKLRGILLAEVKTLIARDVCDRRPVDSIKGGNGYASMGTDLSTLVGVLRAHPDEVSAKTTALVDEAQKISQQIIWEAPKRGSEASPVDAANDDRRRAFTLLAHAYDQARRAISFIRWHEDDVDTFVPSFYAGRGGHGAKSNDEHETPAPAPGAAAGASNDSSPEHVAFVSATAAHPVVPVGHPNSSPFTDA